MPVGQKKRMVSQVSTHATTMFVRNDCSDDTRATKSLGARAGFRTMTCTEVQGQDKPAMVRQIQLEGKEVKNEQRITHFFHASTLAYLSQIPNTSPLGLSLAHVYSNVSFSSAT